MSNAFYDDDHPRPGELLLLEGEHPDVHQDAAELLGAEWLYVENLNFGGKTPHEVIEEGHGDLVRNNLRLIKYVGFS